jgi:hypothetical protein
MNITIIIADWGKTVNGSQYTLHFSPNSHESNIMFSLDELSDPASCSYKILRKEDLEDTFLDHEAPTADEKRFTFEARLESIYSFSKAPERSFKD